MSNKNQPILTGDALTKFDEQIESILADHREGKVSSQAVTLGLGHFVSALDSGNEGEVREWLNNARERVLTSKANRSS